MKFGIRRYWILLVIGSCLPCLAQITGKLTAAGTGQPIDHGLVMGEGINWAYSNEDGQFILPKGRFRGANAPPQVPVTFRADGFRPVTRVAESEDAVLDVQLELNLASDWIISQCEKAAANRTIGSEMRFTLPPKTAPAESYHDVDYGGEFVTTKIDGKTFSMRTMRGAMCCGGRPLPSRYLNSRNIVERAWTLKANGRVFDGMDSRGIAADGTLWRWVGPLLGEQAEYQDANEQAAKFFDSILDTMCIAPKF